MFLRYLLDPRNSQTRIRGDFRSENYRKDFLQFSDAAVAEIRFRIQSGGFEHGIGVRIAPASGVGVEIDVSFDYPVSDGRDLLSEVKGLVVLVDKSDEAPLARRRIDFVAEEFFAS